MTVAETRAERDGRERAGTRALSLLATPLNGRVLLALGAEPLRLADLRRRTDSPPESTLRARLRELAELEVLTKQVQGSPPGVVRYELTGPGRELLSVAELLQVWLAGAPRRALALGSKPARDAIKALADGWGTSMLRALAIQPFSLTELARLDPGPGYNFLERRLAALRSSGQVEAVASRGNGTPYAATPWLRRGVAPLIAAIRWERQYLREEAAALTAEDVEGAFLLAAPLLELPPEYSGSCRLAVELDGNPGRIAGATVGVERGRPAHFSPRLDGRPDAWAVAPAATWIAAALEGEPDRLELGGDRRLATALLDNLHGSLFGAAARSAPS